MTQGLLEWLIVAQKMRQLERADLKELVHQFAQTLLENCETWEEAQGAAVEKYHLKTRLTKWAQMAWDELVADLWEEVLADKVKLDSEKDLEEGVE